MDLRRFLIFGISLLVLCTMQNCTRDVDYQLKLNFYYKNNSTRTLLIKHYDDRNTGGELVLTNTFTIPPQDSVLFDSVSTEGDKVFRIEDFDRYFQMNPNVDSVYIAFDSERFQTYTLEDNKPRSVLDMRNYEAEEISINSFRFVYTFTEADYAGAAEL